MSISISTEDQTLEESVYIAPAVVDLGNVRELTKGSSGSGTADANSQYYWA